MVSTDPQPDVLDPPDQVLNPTRATLRDRVSTRLNGRPASHRKRHNLKLDEQAKEDYLRQLPRLVTSTLALRAAGATPSQLARWREQDGAFCVAERQAREEIADQLEAEAVRRAFRGVRKPVYQGGLLAGYLTEYSDTLLVFVLKAMRPERFRDRSEVSVNPIVKVVAGFDPAQVL